MERSVGVSPYLHATIELQKMYGFSRQQCVSIIYNCVTNESPYFFYCVFQEMMEYRPTARDFITKMCPPKLGVWFHRNMQEKIDNKKKDIEEMALPRRHQPHNGKGASDTKIHACILNLLELVDEYCFLDGHEAKTQ